LYRTSACQAAAQDECEAEDYNYESEVDVHKDLEGDEEDNKIEESETENMPTKKAVSKKTSTPSKPATAARKSSTPKKTSFVVLDKDEDDINDMFAGLAIKGKNYSLEIKHPWKRSCHLKTLPDLQYYEEG
jgi:hypothetical protein